MSSRPAQATGDHILPTPHKRVKFLHNDPYLHLTVIKNKAHRRTSKRRSCFWRKLPRQLLQVRDSPEPLARGSWNTALCPSTHRLHSPHLPDSQAPALPLCPTSFSRVYFLALHCFSLLLQPMAENRGSQTPLSTYLYYYYYLIEASVI